MASPPEALEADLARLDKIAEWLDNKFSLAGVRFGLDSFIGFIPYAGDVAGLSTGAFLVRLISRRGASLGILLKILGNYLLDAIVGIVPLIGDLFDIAHKANRRNVALLRAYYTDPDPKPPAGISLAILAILVLALFVGMFWAGGLIISWLWHKITS